MNSEDIKLMTEKLQSTARCRPEVEQAAVFFSALEPKGYEELIRPLIDTGEDHALGILLNICAVNKIRLTPELLVETLGVVEDFPDFAAPFYMQDHSAIEPLLAMSMAENISWQRQVFAGRLAAELTVRFDQDPKPVKKVLIKLSKIPVTSESRLFNMESIALLDIEDIPDDIPWLTTSEPLKNLPKEKPPVVIGGTYSVRRPVPKLGRNEPCHCGSGKKYKKCCLEKDKELIRDASPYEGVTMTELKSKPGLADDTMIIEEMRAYELKKLEPSNLGSRQLFTAYRRCNTFGLYDLALDMLVELQGRSDFDFDEGHFIDLMESALSAKDLELAKKIQTFIPDDQLFDPEENEFRFKLLENPSWLKELESLSRRALTGESEEWDNSLSSISYNLENIYPALSIIFSRAAILGLPDNVFEQENLLDVIHAASIELDINPKRDPVEEYLDWLYDKKESDLENDIQGKEIEELRTKVLEAKQLAAQQQKEIRDKEHELEDLQARLLKKEKASNILPQSQNDTPATSQHDPQMISRLRDRIENLKLDISRGQQERRTLRKQIKQTIQQADGQAKIVERGDRDDSTDHSIAFEDVPKKILFPEFSNDYKNSCNNIAGSVVVKSIKAAAGLASHDRQVWRQTKALTGLTSIYSIRVGIHHRLLIRWEKDIRLEVLDLIHREQLDTWIKGFR